MTGEPSGTASSAQRRVRAADADRHRVVHRLQEAVGLGQLGLDEGSDRMARAWASRYLDELPELTADLPAPAPAAPAVAVAPGWRALAALALLQLRTTLGGTAGQGSRAVKARLAVAAVAALLLVGLLVGLVVGGLEHGPDAGAFADEHFRR